MNFFLTAIFFLSEIFSTPGGAYQDLQRQRIVKGTIREEISKDSHKSHDSGGHN